VEAVLTDEDPAWWGEAVLTDEDPAWWGEAASSSSTSSSSFISGLLRFKAYGHDSI
jgi:hypothetical protein